MKTLWKHWLHSTPSITKINWLTLIHYLVTNALPLQKENVKTTLLQHRVSSYGIILTYSDTCLYTLTHSYSTLLAAVCHLSLCNWTSFMPKVRVWWHRTYLCWSMTYMYNSASSSDPITLETMLTVNYHYRTVRMTHTISGTSYSNTFFHLQTQ